MSARVYVPGDRVAVRWMGQNVEAVIESPAHTTGKNRVWRLAIPAVQGSPMYYEHEFLPAAVLRPPTPEGDAESGR